MIYLDNAATTFPKPNCVYEAVDHTQRNTAVNVGRGSYQIASDAMKVVDETRILMAELLNAHCPNDIVFSPSATIAANQIIMGLDWDEYKVVYISPFEHNAIARPLELIRQTYGVTIHLLPFDSQNPSSKTRRVFFRMLYSEFESHPPAAPLFQAPHS